MVEPALGTFTASDGYPIHVARWPGTGTVKADVVVLHGVQSHGGWYHNLGRTLAEAGYETHFPDRRGSGASQRDRGHTSSYKRLLADLAEQLKKIRDESPGLPIALAGISWGGKLAVLLAGLHPELIDALALICPGLQPRVGVSRRERLEIAVAYFTNRRKNFPIPLSDPALFTANPAGQSFIASDPLSLRQASAGLLAASTLIDLAVVRIPPKVRQPVLLMLAGQDRIVDNAKTRAYFERLASTERTIIEYPEGHHTLEFEPDASQYALDLVAWLEATFGPNRAETGT
jgi:alpha-beta hydrolase superfamily lysophospholipase